MSPLLRGGLLVASLAGAFVAGYLLKPARTIRIVAAEPPVTHTAAKPPAPPIQIPDVRLPDSPRHDPQVKPAVELGPPRAARPEPPDPLDAAGMAMIGKELGIKTTILDKKEPVPAVLADAQKQAAPMGGPMPRLDPTPVPAIPTIPDIAPPPPSSPAAVKLVNTRAVALDFELTRLGTSPVTAVELWTTRDGGQTWARTDRIAGNQSPFRTRLGSDGEYGFRLVCESEAGMRSPEPKPGDRPDLRVELDTTPPRVTGPVIGPAESSRGKVRIEWQVADIHVAPDRVRLEYSTDGRTWVATRFDPTGIGDHLSHFSRLWTVPPGLPHRVLLRLTVTDQAGNETTAELPRPVSIDLVAPAGKVTGVRTSDSDVGPMPREVEAAMEPAQPSPEAIRSLLPALLASPSVFPPLAPEPVAAHRLPCGVTGNDDPAGQCAGCIVESRPFLPEPTRTAREWVGQLTDTTVVQEPPLSPYRRPDPFALPVVRVESMPAVLIDSADMENAFDHCQFGGSGIVMDRRLPETPEEEARRLDAEQRRAANDRPLIPSLLRRTGEHLKPFRETAVFSGGRSLIHHLADPDWKPTTATPESCRWEYEPVPINFWGNFPLGLRFEF